MSDELCMRQFSGVVPGLVHLQPNFWIALLKQTFRNNWRPHFIFVPGMKVLKVACDLMQQFVHDTSTHGIRLVGLNRVKETARCDGQVVAEG